ncbi:MAG: hypothetical protein JWM02_374 [Frankiales bacterium]|nr:hypothetical protein [Frankiales bacterium]
MSLVDVLIVNYRTGASAVRAAAAVTGPEVNICLWDNSGELLAGGHPEVQGTGDNLFFAVPNQRMFEATKAPYVLLLNPDVVLDHFDLQRLVETLAADRGAWGAAPRLLWPDGRDQNYLRRLPTTRALAAELAPPLRWLLWRSWSSYRCLDVDLRAEQRVEQPPAACLLLKRERVGSRLFDERFPLFFNDVELCRRLATDGTCLYRPEVTAVHEGGGSIKQGRRAGVPVQRMYDEALLAYAEANLRGSSVLKLVAALRRQALRGLGRES